MLAGSLDPKPPPANPPITTSGPINTSVNPDQPVTPPPPARTIKAYEVPRTFRTGHPLGWSIWKGEDFAPTEEELLSRIQG
jgi:hypothetical protein